MARVSADELHAMMAAKRQPLIVDVRGHASRLKGRIPGAIWIDSKAFDHSVRAQSLHQRTVEDVVVYCDCPNEASAAAVAKKLMRVGFKRVRPLAGGLSAWAARGYEVETGEVKSPHGAKHVQH